MKKRRINVYIYDNRKNYDVTLCKICNLSSVCGYIAF